ncbi:hypothetical protein DACRYDRAFT_23003 [Dacryopinax primogenitus]|uniref:Uncharacterized protein n=1 Tax=Dacryopinax primogenitus (strain DJM 731) TaxID=1858805 RepID=M5FW04_DACPD|nr:uncharacterized protein DACRYDRAFT_23003 [Dacryopinax primogenitus]EJU00544.1 hypothetical protein DACRYDRAFT_23003 [Dacryopinax primogenitus]
MSLLSLIRSLSNRHLRLDTNAHSSELKQLRPRPSCEQRVETTRECIVQSIDGILLAPPEKDAHRRTKRVRGRHISFDKTTEAHQHFKSLGYPRPLACQVEEPRQPYQPQPAHWSRSYHLMYEGCEGPIIQDAMYMSLMAVLFPEPTQTPFVPPEAPVLPSIESFATIKHHAINDDFSLETFTPASSPPSTPKSSPRRRTVTGNASPRRTQVFLRSSLADSPASRPSPVRSVQQFQETPTRKTPTFKRLQDSVSMQAVLGLSVSVSTSLDSTANFALGVVVASESRDSGKTWDSIKDLNMQLQERRRTQTAAF